MPYLGKRITVQILHFDPMIVTFMNIVVVRSNCDDALVTLTYVYL